MDITIFLAQIWGPIILSISLGILFSYSFYVRIYKNLEKETFSILLFGMCAMMLGIIHIQMHTLWDTIPQVIVSILGFGLLLKGIAFIVFPRIIDIGGNVIVKFKLVSIIGVLMLILGIYISWFGYFV